MQSTLPVLCPAFVPILQLLVPLGAFHVSGVVLAYVPVKAPAFSCSSWTTIAVEIIAGNALGRDLRSTAWGLADASALVVILNELVVFMEPKGNSWESFFTCGWTYEVSNLKRIENGEMILGSTNSGTSSSVSTEKAHCGNGMLVPGLVLELLALAFLRN